MKNSNFLTLISFFVSAVAILALMIKGPSMAWVIIAFAGFFTAVMACVCKTIEDSSNAKR